MQGSMLNLWVLVSSFFFSLVVVAQAPVTPTKFYAYKVPIQCAACKDKSDPGYSDCLKDNCPNTDKSARCLLVDSSLNIYRVTDSDYKCDGTPPQTSHVQLIQRNGDVQKSMGGSKLTSESFLEYYFDDQNKVRLKLGSKVNLDSINARSNVIRDAILVNNQGPGDHLLFFAFEDAKKVEGIDKSNCQSKFLRTSEINPIIKKSAIKSGKISPSDVTLDVRAYFENICLDSLLTGPPPAPAVAVAPPAPPASAASAVAAATIETEINCESIMNRDHVNNLRIVSTLNCQLVGKGNYRNSCLPKIFCKGIKGCDFETCKQQYDSVNAAVHSLLERQNEAIDKRNSARSAMNRALAYLNSCKADTKSSSDKIKEAQEKLNAARANNNKAREDLRKVQLALADALKIRIKGLGQNCTAFDLASEAGKINSSKEKSKLAKASGLSVNDFAALKFIDMRTELVSLYDAFLKRESVCSVNPHGGPAGSTR